jgi:hypothetical protein
MCDVDVKRKLVCMLESRSAVLSGAEARSGCKSKCRLQGLLKLILTRVPRSNLGSLAPGVMDRPAPRR